MIQGAIFDIDGTLLDSMGIWEDVGLRYLKSLQIMPEPNLVEILFPMSMEEAAIYLKEHYHIAKETAEIKEEVLHIIAEFYYKEVSLKAGVKNILEAFQKRNIPMVLATSGDEKLALAALKRLGVDRYFSKIFTCTDLKTSKREPVIYQKAIEFIQASAREVIVFEDVLHAQKVAKDLGCIIVGVEDDSSKGDKAQIIETSDYYIQDFREIENLLEEIFINH